MDAARIRSRPSLLFRLSRHRAGMVGAVVVITFLAGGLLAPFIAPYDPFDAVMRDRLQGPSASHWLGTDELGRDILSRILHGATLSMRAGVTVVVLGVALGVPIGAISGYTGG